MLKLQLKFVIWKATLANIFNNVDTPELPKGMKINKI